MDRLNFAEKLIEKAKKKDIDTIELVYSHSDSVSASSRLGKLEELERNNAARFGVRAIKGQKQAFIGSSDFSEHTLDNLTTRLVDMLKLLPEDPDLIIADPKDYVKNVIDLDLFDPTIKSEAELIEMAIETENFALEKKHITNSEGAGASFTLGQSHYISSNGFRHSFNFSSYGLSVSVVAGEGEEMQTDYAYTTARHFDDLRTAREIGELAAKRAATKLNPQKLATGNYPIIFEPRVANLFNGVISSAANGESIAQGVSFLQAYLGKQLFPENVNFVDDPHMKRGLGSCPFDGEFLPNKRLDIVKDGVLKEWFLDLRSGKKLGMKSNGRASRPKTSSPYPTTTNFYLAPGDISPEDLIKRFDNAILITSLIGSGANMVTGDYSEGAEGFLVRGGKIEYPVSEFTIAGNFLEMFKQMIICNDTEFANGINAPTIGLENMSVAGS